MAVAGAFFCFVKKIITRLGRIGKNCRERQCRLAARAVAEVLGKIDDEDVIRSLVMALMEEPVGESAAKALRDLGVEEDIVLKGPEFALAHSSL